MRQQEASAIALVLQQVAQMLGGATGDVAADEPLMAAGLTSTLAVQLTQRLEGVVGSELPGTLVFDYPSASEIAAFLVAEGLLPSSGTGASAPAASALHPAAAAPPAAHQRAMLAELVLREVASLSGGAAGDVAADEPLMAAGLTSALAVQLVSALEAAVGAELPGTLVFDYPTAAEIADFMLAEGLAPAAAAVAAVVPLPAQLVVPAPVAEIVQEPAAARPLCAITAAAHAVPGGSLTFQPGSAGNDRITPVPLERWDVEASPADSPGGEWLGRAASALISCAAFSSPQSLPFPLLQS